MKITVKSGDRELSPEEAEAYFRTPQGQYARHMTPVMMRSMRSCLLTAIGIVAFLIVMALWAMEIFWPF